MRSSDEPDRVGFLPTIVAWRFAVVPRKQFGRDRTVFDLIPLRAMAKIGIRRPSSPHGAGMAVIIPSRPRDPTAQCPNVRPCRNCGGKPQTFSYTRPNPARHRPAGGRCGSPARIYKEGNRAVWQRRSHFAPITPRKTAEHDEVRRTRKERGTQRYLTGTAQRFVSESISHTSSGRLASRIVA